MANIDIGLTRSRSRNLTVFATLLSMIAPFSINTYLPSFQAIEKEFGITRAMSQVVLYFALAPAIAPLLGGLLHEYFGWRSVFWFLAAFGSLLGLMGFFVSETLEPEHRRSIHPAIVVRTYINSLLHKHFPALIFSWALAFAGLFLYIAGAPTIIFDFLHLGTNEFVWLYLPIVVGTMLGGAISSRLAHRWPAQKTISVGMGLMILAAMINIIVTNLAAANILVVIGPLLLYVTGFAFVIPALTVMALDCMPTHRGTAVSMQGFVQVMAGAGVASFVVPLLSARLLDFVLGQAVFILLAVGLWYRLNRQQ